MGISSVVTKINAASPRLHTGNQSFSEWLWLVIVGVFVMVLSVKNTSAMLVYKV